MTLYEAQQRINQLLSLMNNKNQPFDVLLKYYEEASALITFCYKEINKNKGKFEELKDRLARAREEELKNV